MRVADLLAFAARRRTAQEEVIEALRPVVSQSLADRDEGVDNWYAPILESLETAFYATVAADGAEREVAESKWSAFSTTMEAALKKADTATGLVEWLAVAAINAGTLAAAAQDSEPYLLEWVDMNDSNVRRAHREASGQRVPPGEKFRVGESDLDYPGDPKGARVEDWISCRCSVAPVPFEEVTAAVEVGNTSTVIVALPAADSPVHDIGEEDKHVTLAFLGTYEGDPEMLGEIVESVSSEMGPFVAQVSGHAQLGPDKAKVLLVEAPEIQSVRNSLLLSPEVTTAVEAADSHPHFVPHVTLTYGDDMPESDLSEIQFDRLAVWHGDDRSEFPLGDAMTQTVDEPTEAPPEDTVEPETIEPAGLIPWHGVAAPEGVWSGDGRRFAEGSLEFRDLPLPLTWQKVSSEGHMQSIVVGSIEQAERVDNKIEFSGVFLQNPEADEVVGLIGHFGKFGVSIDADNGEFEFDEEEGESTKLTFTKARMCSACIVPIPAFQEAFVALGERPAAAVADEPVAASLSVTSETGEVITFKRGAGWVTHPEDTKRIHDYWTRPGEPGYAKIGWGTPDDFYRCRALVGEKIATNSPEDLRYINQICARWHKDALGFWPGEHNSAETVQAAITAAGDEGQELLKEHGQEAWAGSLHLVAAATSTVPASWFADPGLKELTHLTVTEDGRVFGHIAEWTTCHIGFPDMCVTPPESAADYAYFTTGEVLTDQGPVSTGVISLGGGHAPGGRRAAAAVAHYDSTSTGVADVAVGEDEIGIWCAGRIRPGVSPEAVTALRASDISGDWRKIGDAKELIAVLAVNVAGFPVPRTRVGVENGEQISLVAAGMVHRTEEQKLDIEELGAAVGAYLAALSKRQERLAELRNRVLGGN